jgi:hypothetical protein
MTTVKFYIFIDADSDFDTITNNITDRFQSDYPEAEVDTDYDEDEEMLSISLNVDTEDIEYIDTFLCEEISQENEVYCEIKSENSEETKNYYFDEEDKWIYKN